MKVPSPSIIIHIGMFLMSPYLLVMIKKYMAKFKPDKNCIKKHAVEMGEEFVSWSSKDYSMIKAKALVKEKGITFNDLMMGITSRVLKLYFKSKGDESSQISITCPMAFKVIPDKVKNYTFGNDFSAITIYFKLIENLDEAIAASAK